MSQIEFRVPDATQPGYLRRLRLAMAFQQDLEKGMSAALFDQMVNFFLPYISEPADRAQAREALLDASEKQLKELLELLKGQSASPLPERSAPSTSP